MAIVRIAKRELEIPNRWLVTGGIVLLYGIMSRRRGPSAKLFAGRSRREPVRAPTPERRETLRPRPQDVVEEASIESFPASDPPAW